MSADALACDWVRLAQPVATRVDLRRSTGLVAFAALAAFVAWWFPQHPDPYSYRWASKATYIALASPPLVVGLLSMAAARLLVGTRAIAALYGRSTEQGVELAGLPAASAGARRGVTSFPARSSSRRPSGAFGSFRCT